MNEARRRKITKAVQEEHGLHSEEEVMGVPVEEVQHFVEERGLGVRLSVEDGSVRFSRPYPAFTEEEQEQAMTMLDPVFEKVEEEGDEDRPLAVDETADGFWRLDGAFGADGLDKAPRIFLTVATDADDFCFISFTPGQLASFAHACRIACCATCLMDNAILGQKSTGERGKSQ